MPYKVLPMLVGTLMFSLTSGTLASKGNLETSKAKNPDDASMQDLERLKIVHALGYVFDDPQMESTPYSPVNESNK
ncbi:MAG: hypothetical protein BGO67_08885 [Alphaproteobacteria bacterium 41-28]|nr:MAG: hypothetical protein BGO67_08885 [Alphaproteobacteria bacterium 41-28]